MTNLQGAFELEVRNEFQEYSASLDNDDDDDDDSPANDAYIGFAQISQVYNKMGEYYANKNNFNSAQKNYMIAVELNNTDAMMNLAVLLEYNGESREVIEKYYIMALNGNPRDTITAYNFADYYRTIGDEENMVKYYNAAIEFGNDIESMMYLAKHYKKKDDSETSRNYYLKAIRNGLIKKIQTHFYDYTYRGDYYRGVDSFNLVKILETASEDELPKSDCEKYIQMLAGLYFDVAIYRNKVSLFTKLNHVVECGICYEDKLNIDLFCGHCVCKDCYVRVYDTDCPFCRINPRYQYQSLQA